MEAKIRKYSPKLRNLMRSLYDDSAVPVVTTTTSPDGPLIDRCVAYARNVISNTVSDTFERNKDELDDIFQLLDMVSGDENDVFYMDTVSTIENSLEGFMKNVLEIRIKQQLAVVNCMLNHVGYRMVLVEDDRSVERDWVVRYRQLIE